MNKRQKGKLQKIFNNRCLNARQSCIYCINWGMGCANGHPDVYPGDRSDYLFSCKEKMDAYKHLAKRLKKEGYSLSGWKFFESPAENVYIFQNRKKWKDITVLYVPEKSEYQIMSTDCLWRYSDEYNVYEHDSIKEALKMPWQHYNFMLDKSNKKKRRRRTIEKLKYQTYKRL